MPECPTCNDVLDTEHGVKIHHASKHGESLVPEEPCAHCGQSVRVPPSKMKYNNHFCSKSCQGKWRGERWDMFQSKPSDVECYNCGDVFKKRPAKIKTHDRHFCSRECMGDAYSDLLTGEDNPKWRGGSENPYPPDWEQIRKDIISRDGHSCQLCGMSEEEHVETHDMGLHVHHKNPVSNGGSNLPDNLITLCLQCHVEEEHDR